MEIDSTRQDIEGGAFLLTWPSMAAGDTGKPIRFAGAADRTVQVIGTFGGAAVVMEGSLDGANYATLTDPQGNALNISTAKLETILELTRYLRPRIDGGDGTTNLTVALIARSTMR